jgi:uncharacterized protein (UPF0303 family)
MINLDLIEIKPGIKFSLVTLKKALPDVETLLFFAKLYKLDAYELGRLMREVLGESDVIRALTAESGEHSAELQDYMLELGYEYLIESGAIVLGEVEPKGEVLPEMWKDMEVTIAKSIQEVADKLKDVVGALPGKQGEMIFRTMRTVNAKRPILGDHKALIHHAPQREHLVVLDVSGSMSEPTIRTIIEDVMALTYMANAHLAVVSDTATHWGPGEATVDAVLSVAEYSGTHYETLAALMDQDWGVVVTIADYDSSYSAMSAIKSRAGHIQQLLDISLVNRPTFLAEVLGQLADEVRPLLVAKYNLT